MHSTRVASSNPTVGYKVTSGPKVLAREILLFSHEKSSDHNSAFPLQIPNHIGYRVLRRCPQAHVNVIRSQMPFNNLHFLTSRQLVKHVAEHPPDLTLNQLDITKSESPEFEYRLPEE